MAANSISAKVDQIGAEFADLEPRERLELLLEFAEGLPPLPPRLQAEKDAGEHRVPECMTPVFLWVELDRGKVRIFGDVAPEAPTVKGFVGIMAEVFSGAAPAEVLSTPSDLVEKLGLVQALGMQRMHGLHAILHRVRVETQKLVS
ncbi:MAG TPA: SufE family protein [Pirellulales bacterium]|nr:SufE family protein [Pirellulales bacterium]